MLKFDFFIRRVTQFVGKADTILADSIRGKTASPPPAFYVGSVTLDISGFIEEFQRLQDGGNANRKILAAQSFDQYYDTFRPSEQEYYSFSELPRRY